MRIAMMGAGAIGGITGAMMASGGEDITLVDTYEAHVDKINSDGIEITGELGEHLVRIPASLPADLEGKFDLVFLVVKGIDTDDALSMLEPHMHDSTPVVSLQNGINEEDIAGVIGEERTVGASTHFGATFEAPGHLNKTTHGGFIVGELDGRVTDRVTEIGRLLSLVESTEVTDNIWGHLWSKLLINVCTNSFGALTGEKFGVFATREVGKKALSALYTESYDVAVKQGIELVKLVGVLDPEFMLVRGEEDRQRVEPVLDYMARPDQFGNMYSSMLQDMDRGRRTEVDHLNGYIVSKGAEIGMPTPVNEAIVEMVKEVEAGTRKLDPANISELSERLESP